MLEGFAVGFDENKKGALSRRAFVGAFAAGGAAILGASALPQRPAVAFAESGERFEGAGGQKESALREPRRTVRPVFVEPYAVPEVSSQNDMLSKSKRILVVVDYQVDFVDGGVFGTIETAVAIEEALCETIESYLDSGDIVIYTMDTHPADEYENTREATVNPLHCDPETEGWQLYGRVRDLLTPETAIMVKKGTYGAKSLPSIIQAIRDQGTMIQSIEIAGVSTTCRVLHNAILLYNFFPELPIIFDERTTASYTDERTQEQLLELESWGFAVRR